jgi:hypothetical protein
MRHCRDICLGRVELPIMPVNQVSGQNLKQPHEYETVLPTVLQHSTAYFSVSGYSNIF